MTLTPVPGAPGYYVDCDTQTAYSIKSGRIRAMKQRTAYKIVGLSVNSCTVTTTIYRMMYCAVNGIDITRIPDGVCIGICNGRLTVMERADVVRKSNKTKAAGLDRLSRMRKNLELIEEFYKGNTKPLLDYLKRIEKDITLHYIFTYGLCQERAEIASGRAINAVLDRLREGVPMPNIKRTCYMYARQYNRELKAPSFEDWMAAGPITL